MIVVCGFVVSCCEATGVFAFAEAKLSEAGAAIRWRRPEEDECIALGHATQITVCAGADIANIVMSTERQLRRAKPMLLHGSCHCRAVTFTVESPHPYPFNLCYCSICRKTAGAGGYAINLSARYHTLKVNGEQHIRSYHAKMREPHGGGEHESEAERKFCGECGSALWLWDPRWPELMHPHACAIDTPLPTPPERTHLMLASKAAWVEPCLTDGDKVFDEYPGESIAQWHERLKLVK